MVNTANTATAAKVIPFKAQLGAEVHCGDLRELDDDTFKAIRRASLDHLVLLIRGQSLNDDELVAFGRRFGELAAAAPVHIGQKPRERPEIAIISNVIENGMAIGGLGDGEAVWHSDSSFTPVPPTVSILHALELPPSGGGTGFANMYRALETMPTDLLKRIAGKTIKADLRYTSGGQLRPGYTGQEDIREAPGPSHPIIRKHEESGHHALYLGRRPYSYINGLSLDESEALLDAVWAHATKPEFTWHHQWQLGDVLIWDNRCCMHRRDAFDPKSRRIMHRTQCKGVPIVATTAQELAQLQPHPRAA
ncbi:MAG: TauD/TfdA family dioxygenase [Betaproteobacteria bacterium]|nr:TauD/TfdA family dioxygenase [Betaproteobacteria bacterium]